MILSSLPPNRRSTRLNSDGELCYSHGWQDILSLCIGNHELFMRRRTLDSIEVQQASRHPLT